MGFGSIVSSDCLRMPLRSKGCGLARIYGQVLVGGDRVPQLTARLHRLLLAGR